MSSRKVHTTATQTGRLGIAKTIPTKILISINIALQRDNSKILNDNGPFGNRKHYIYRKYSHMPR
jgi:hypothetical protein